MKNAENSGTVIGDNTVGGVAGSNEGVLENAQNLAAGAVTADGMSVGGVTGYNTARSKTALTMRHNWRNDICRRCCRV